MNWKRITSVVFAAGLLAAAAVVRADDIFRADGSALVSGVTVESLTDTEIVLAGEKKIAAADAARIVFTHQPMPPGAVRLILTDGTELGGALRGRAKGKYLFRSAAFGLLEIPVRQTAAMIFTPDFSLKGQKTGGGRPHLLYLKNAPDKPLAGRLLAIEEDNFVFSMVQFIQRVHISSPAAILLTEKPLNENAAVLRLRNGDRIAGKIQRTGGGVTVCFPGAETGRAVPLGAMAEIKLTTSNTTGEKP